MGTSRFIWECIKKERMLLYKGVSLTLPHSFAPTVLYVYIYENLMRFSSNIVDKLTDRKEAKLIFPFFMSSIAEGFALILELPFDTVRTRIQVLLRWDRWTQMSIDTLQLSKVFARSTKNKEYSVSTNQPEYTSPQKPSTPQFNSKSSRCWITITVVILHLYWMLWYQRWWLQR